MFLVSLPFSLTSYVYILTCLRQKIIFLIFHYISRCLEKKQNLQILHEPNLAGL